MERLGVTSFVFVCDALCLAVQLISVERSIALSVEQSKARLDAAV